ncbi:hypothetical protein IW261DRAFT_200354 [Armillaria novae-zelandiae]|uniref:Uncharacterized protein n=1 Tax=Armillaria novae-zelandiae TaxID=153914 RepID=A0AA39NAU8_9AGAR|nr:hypothetical protein IW261DRAFT_200354 [Armillaria novae-zelandiae]
MLLPAIDHDPPAHTLPLIHLGVYSNILFVVYHCLSIRSSTRWKYYSENSPRPIRYRMLVRRHEELIGSIRPSHCPIHGKVSGSYGEQFYELQSCHASLADAMRSRQKWLGQQANQDSMFVQSPVYWLAHAFYKACHFEIPRRFQLFDRTTICLERRHSISGRLF